MRIGLATPHCRAGSNGMTSGLVFFRPVLYGCRRNLRSGGNSLEATVEVGHSLLAGGEAECDDAGCGDEIPQGFLLAMARTRRSGRPSCPASITAYRSPKESTRSFMTST
jgi:hypothetical protein